MARGFTAHQHTSLLDRLAGRLSDRASPSVVLATGFDAPVVVTRRREDDFSRPLRRAAATHLRCTATPFGPRFEDEAGDAETLVYRGADGWAQTTLACWREVLEHRARVREPSAVERTAAAPEVR